MVKDGRYRLIWDIAYILYFLSFFADDVAFADDGAKSLVVKIVRYAAYILFAFLFFFITDTKIHRIIILALAIAFAAFCTLYTRDLYYETLFFIIFTSVRIKPRHILRVSYYLLLSLTVIVVIGSLIKVIPMNNTPRRAGEADRYGMGFYHSDVLPLVLFYLIVFRMLISRKAIEFWRIGLWLVLDAGIYFICGSKNGLAAVGILCLAGLIFRRNKKENNVIRFIAQYLVIAVTLFSLFGMLIQGSGSSVAQFINKITTNRFSLAYRQYQVMGLHFINKMDWNTYSQNRLVIDNGYLFVALRYGLAFLPFYWVVHFLFGKKNRKNTLAMVVLIVVTLANFIDNDLVSYGFLPIILLAFNEHPISDTKAFRLKIAGDTNG